MSLVIQYNQHTKDLERLLVLDNNVGEIIESHGSNLLECQRDYYSRHKDIPKPFDLLPKNYNRMCQESLEGGLFLYDIARIHQYESVKE